MTGDTRCFAGIDVGSWYAKAALVDIGGHRLSGTVVPTGANLVDAATAAIDAALVQAGRLRADVQATWSTGYGRHALPFADHARTELDCHARGVLHFRAGPFTIIDIGGQDAKIIHVDAQGRRTGHKMNRKCAAGTGSFLQEMALRLGVGIEALPALAEKATEDVRISSFCTVFAGTEILTHIREGRNAADLAHAAYRSVVERVLEMEHIQGPVVATGGVVAHHPAVVRLLADALGRPVEVSPFAQESGALGAALAALAAAPLQPTLEPESEP